MTPLPHGGSSVTPRAVIYSGGPSHDFPALSAHLQTLVEEIGVNAWVTEDFAEAANNLPGVDLLIVNALRWRMQADRYATQRAALAFSPTAKSRKAVTQHLDDGGGVLGLHTAVISFDDWPEWGDILGARWDWSRSSHPPNGPARIVVHPDRHSIVARSAEQFDTDDEVYGFLDVAADVAPLLSGSHSRATHPLMWARGVGAGRVVTSTLGHHLRSYQPPEYRRILLRSVQWLLGRPLEPGPAA